MAIDKVLSSSIANGAVTAALISNTANLVVSSLTANVITITTISGSANVTGDMTVGGNLTISGTTTYVNTTDLNIGDAIISLNADLAANVSPTEDAGISINRGASTNAQFKWIESTDNWSLGNTTVSGVLTSNDHVITGTANVSTSINVGANVNLSTSQINVGNSTVNTVISATSLTTNTVTVNNTIDMNKAGNSAGIGFRRSNTYEGYITGISGGGLQFQTGSGLTSNVTIDSSGNMGIGTSSPGDRLHAIAAVAAGLSLQASGTGGSTWRILSTDNAASLGGGYLGFNNGSYRMVLDSSGNLGIGTSSPGYKLEVNGGASDAISLFNSTNINGPHLRFSASSTVKAYIGGAPGFLSSGTADDLGFRAVGSILFATNGSAVDMTLDSSGNLGVGTSSPSAEGKLTVGSTTVTDKNGIILNRGAAATPSGVQGAIFYEWNGFGSSESFSFRTNGGYKFQHANGTSFATIDTSGNLGVGVTPSAWDSTYKAIQVGARSMFSGIGSEANILNNAYYSSGYKYVANSSAGLYTIDANVHKWYNAPSGTAGANVSFTQAMTLDASGNFVIGNTTAWGRLHVTKSVNNTATAATNISDYQNATFILHNQDEAGTGNKAGMFFAFAGSPGILAGMDGYKVSGNWNTGLRWYTNNSTGVNVGNFTEKMRMDPDGNLGVGTASPASRFTVEPQSDTSNAITFRKTGQTSFGTLMAYADANGPSYAFGSNYSSTSAGSVSRANTSYAAWSIAMDCRPTNTAMVFDYISSSGTYSERMRINSSGYVGIGTSSPTTPLSVVGMANFGGVLMGSPLNTTNDNSGCVMLHKLGQSGGYQFSGDIVANSWTGNAMISVNIIVDYVNDSVYYQVLSASTLNSGSSTKTTLQLVKVTYGGFSYLGIRKNGGGTGTIYLNGATQCNVPYPFEIASGSYTVTSTLGTLN